MPKIYFVVTFFLYQFPVLSQLNIDTSFTIEELINDVLIGEAEDLKIDNIKYKGAKKSIGMFKCDMKYNTFIKKGIILSTGDVMEALGPNTSAGKSSTTYINSDRELESIAYGQTFDAAVLEFDLESDGDSISFNFLFASEEYPEYVNRNVNDVFAFFITDIQSGERNNIALLQPGNITVTVDHINSKSNSNFFIENASWDENNLEQWRNKKQLGELALTFEFDGFTKLIHASMPVTKGKSYHIKLAIADVGDRQYDSAIFLEAGSFKNNIFKDNSIGMDIVKSLFSEDQVLIKDHSFSVNLNINFETDSSRIQDDLSFQLLDKVLKIMKDNTALKLEVNGHTDKRGSFEYNLILSQERAKHVAEHLKKMGVDPERITYTGFGNTKPISTNEDLNRRVEFVFKE